MGVAQVLVTVLAVPASLMAARALLDRHGGQRPGVWRRLREVKKLEEVAEKLGDPCPPNTALRLGQARRELQAVSEISYDNNELSVIARSQPVALVLVAVCLILTYLPLHTGPWIIVTRALGVGFWVAGGLWWFQWRHAARRLRCRQLLFARFGEHADEIVLPPLSGWPLVGRTPWVTLMTRWINRTIGTKPIALEEIPDSSVAEMNRLIGQWCASGWVAGARRRWTLFVASFEQVT
ncbi:hypothetical protein [Nocardia heshunensis]